MTGEDPLISDEIVENRIVPLAIVRLKNDGIPVQPEPGQVAFHMLDIARLGPLPIQIFEPQDDFRAIGSGIEPTEQSGNQGSRMNTAGR